MPNGDGTGPLGNGCRGGRLGQGPCGSKKGTGQGRGKGLGRGMGARRNQQNQSGANQPAVTTQSKENA